jgi:hypothetical protein
MMSRASRRLVSKESAQLAAMLDDGDKFMRLRVLRIYAFEMPRNGVAVAPIHWRDIEQSG